MASMREYQRRVERPSLKLRRGADGRLRTSSSDHEIGDIWAEQRRIRLAEAILEDKRKAEKKAQRKEKFSKLFKRKQAPPAAPTNIPREIVLNISIPKVKLPKLPKPRFAKHKKRLLTAGGVVVALAVVATGYAAYEVWVKRHISGKRVLTAEGAVQTPQYQTVLPDGKNIGDLGGWARVSPPDKDPVFAFADHIGNVRITVSQQPLPKSFEGDIADSVAEAAKQFGANDTIKMGDVTAYIGTSIKGPQSVVLTKSALLLLIRSDSKISDDEWARYIQTLH